MASDRLIGVVLRAVMDTLLRHLPRWLARRGGGARDPRAARARERDIARKLRLTRRLMRWLR
jgi:hypothetical protein